MKNRTTTSFLHHFHDFSIAVVITFLLLSVQPTALLAQSRNDKLPTVKISKKKRKSPEVKEVKNPEKIKNAYSGPKTSPNTARPKDNYQRPKSLRKAEKTKDSYRQPATRTVNYNNSPQQNQNPPPPYEEGQAKSRESLWKRLFRKKTSSTFEGNLKVNKANEGTEGTDYQGNLKQKKIDYNQLAKDQHLYQGNIRRAPQKRLEIQYQYRAEHMSFYSGGKKVPKPHHQQRLDQQKSADLQSAGLYKVKKQKDEAAGYTTYHGQIKLPTLKTRTRHYKKLSEKVHQYDGDIRYRKPGKDMHPSVFHLKAKTKNSYEQKEKYRRWRVIISHIFKQSDQPKSVKEKERKPRYDKNESEIWYY